MSSEAHKDYAGAKLGMWLFLFTEVFLFGGLFILYATYLARYPGDFARAGAELNVFFGGANTVVLLTSSLTAALALSALQKRDRALALKMLAATLAAAVIFMINKFFEWSAKIDHGIYPGSSHLKELTPGETVFFNLYYLTTGLHGLHVLIGGALLGWIMVQIRRGQVTGEDPIWLENGALYWHLVDLVWIFIFPLYYLVL